MPCYQCGFVNGWISPQLRSKPKYNCDYEGLGMKLGTHMCPPPQDDLMTLMIF